MAATAEVLSGRGLVAVGVLQAMTDAGYPAEAQDSPLKAAADWLVLRLSGAREPMPEPLSDLRLPHYEIWCSRCGLGGAPLLTKAERAICRDCALGAVVPF